MRTEAIVFDHDGTLVDSEPITLNLLAEMAVEYGADVRDGDAERFVGADLRLALNEIAKRRGSPLPLDFLDIFRARQSERIVAELRPMAGADILLDALTAPMAVASNAPQSKMKLCLGAAGLSHHFTDERLVSAYDVGEWKPSPAVFLAAAEVLNVAPERCAVVEDSAPGIEAGLAAGMRVFALDPTNAFGPVENVTCLRSLPELLDHLD